VIRQDIVDRMVEDCGVTKTTASKALASLLATLQQGLVRQQRVELRGVGCFKVRNRKSGVGRNPKTGIVILIEDGKIVKFKASRTLDIRQETTT
jgi:DNA-binding protein HU-beta